MIFCPLFSGSTGNAALVATTKTQLLVDAGVSALAIGKALSNLSVSLDTICGVLVTHEHTDHIAGIVTLSKRYGIPIYANEKTWLAMGKVAGQVPVERMRVFETGCEFYIGDIAVQSFPTPHDAAASVGFTLSAKGKTITCMTDIGYLHPNLLAQAKGADVVLIESNHDVDLLKQGPYPVYLKRRILSKVGHLSNADAGVGVRTLAQNGVRRFYLGHLSAQNNREDLANAAVTGALALAGITPGKDVALVVAKKDMPSPIAVLE